jgi:hypothetical protein
LHIVIIAILILILMITINTGQSCVGYAPVKGNTQGSDGCYI